jgi:hypothetical protein
MCAQWNTKPDYCADIEMLLRQFAIDKVDSTGGASFNSTEAFNDCKAMLYESIRLNQEIHRRERIPIIHNGLFDAYSASGRVDRRLLLKAIQKRESEYLKQPLKQFRMQTQLNIEYMRSLKRVRTGPSQFSFSPTPNPRLRIHQSVLDRINLASNDRPPFGGWTYLCITCQGRTCMDAGWRALDELLLLLGMWNYAVNFPVIQRTSAGVVRAPVNEILAGPYYTLHEVGNSQPSETYWHNTPLLPITTVARVKDKWDEIEHVRTRVQKKLRDHSYADDVRSALRRYNTALDDSDWDASFLRLWSLLEFLTATSSPQSRHDDTVKRAAFVWDEPDYAVKVLNLLRITRNKQVHHSVEVHDAEGAIYSLKRYVEALLRFHLRNEFKFASLTDAGAFLSLPTDQKVLQEKGQAYRAALKFRES